MVNIIDKVPCKRCLCRAVCRNKDFERLVNECQLLCDYIWTGRKYYIDRFIRGDVSYVYTTIKEVETRLVSMKLVLDSKKFKIFFTDIPVARIKR